MSKEEWRPTKSELEAYFSILATELNFRLCMESQRYLLWVEEITLTSYEEGNVRHLSGWRRVLNCLKKKLKKYYAGYMAERKGY